MGLLSWLNPGWAAPVRWFRNKQDEAEIDREIAKMYPVAGTNKQRAVEKLDNDEDCIEDRAWGIAIFDWKDNIGKIVEVQHFGFFGTSTIPYLVTRVERYRGTFASHPDDLARVYGRRVKR